MARIAVVLMNLGGPDSLAAVEPFLINLFSDPAIIRLPWALRMPLARLIAHARARTARKIYSRLGGASPLLVNTRAQAEALERALGPDYRSFIAMRYWHPTSGEAAKAVAAWQPEEIVCLPLYPQLSTTTTSSSLAAWRRAAADLGIDRPTRVVCCYPDANGFIEAVVGLARPALERASEFAKPPRLLLTAHGLPKKIAETGDPYRNQVGLTARAIVAALARPGLDWQVCYQSRVGPLEWIGPATDGEVRRAGRDGVPVVMVPISFVSEHSETLVELDIDYREIAEKAGVPAYFRVATVGVERAFIDELAQAVVRAVPQTCPALAGGVCADEGQAV
ncbi:MAG: ferrochelatase [Alphaproteobacteria bacterium]|nr:ferrochelatase [Alphaproteobacteria bacterium]